MAKILVIDDERSIRNSMKDILSFEGHEVLLAENGMEGLASVKTDKPELVFCDIKMPKVEGIEVLKRIKEFTTETPVIMISGHGTIDTAIDAIKNGAYDFIEKPLDLNRILITIKNATDKTQLIQETRTLKTKVSKKYEMIGNSEALERIKVMIDKVAVSDARVLITGPNGCGKELVAHQIHEKSNRRDRAFIEVNCAAIPSELIESELFGHEKGSFTSAIKQKKGKFELAHGGTIFLDEIGDMSFEAQAKVLRALPENKQDRRRQRYQCGCEGHRRHQQKSERRNCKRKIPGRPLSPAQRHHHRSACPERTSGRHRRTDKLFSERDMRRYGHCL